LWGLAEAKVRRRVLETLLENAVRLSGAKHGMIFRYDSECCHAAADYNNPPDYASSLSPFASFICPSPNQVTLKRRQTSQDRHHQLPMHR
jgi:hypothetical protein